MDVGRSCFDIRTHPSYMSFSQLPINQAIPQLLRKLKIGKLVLWIIFPQLWPGGIFWTFTRFFCDRKFTVDSERVWPLGWKFSTWNNTSEGETPRKDQEFILCGQIERTILSSLGKGAQRIVQKSRKFLSLKNSFRCLKTKIEWRP
jgi:hypothetical protein